MSRHVKFWFIEYRYWEHLAAYRMTDRQNAILQS